MNQTIINQISKEIPFSVRQLNEWITNITQSDNSLYFQIQNPYQNMATSYQATLTKSLKRIKKYSVRLR